MARAGGRAPLALAAAEGQTAMVEFLLKKGAEVGAKDAAGRTAIMRAAEGGYMAVVRALEDAGANVKETDNSGGLPSSSPHRRHTEMVSDFLAKGADVNAYTKLGWTPLMVASGEGHVETAKVLLEQGARVDYKDADKRTALLWAAGRGQTAMVELIADKGAQLDGKDGDGRNGVWLAASQGHDETLTLLLERGRKKWPRSLRYFRDAGDRRGQTPLMAAAEGGHIGGMNRLIDAGSRIKTRSRRTGWTALLIAANQGPDGGSQALDGQGGQRERQDQGWPSVSDAGH